MQIRCIFTRGEGKEKEGGMARGGGGNKYQSVSKTGEKSTPSIGTLN